MNERSSAMPTCGPSTTRQDAAHSTASSCAGARRQRRRLPQRFRHADAWFMVYVCMNKVGYETHLARSDDLLKWQPLGKILRSVTRLGQVAGGRHDLSQDFSWGGPATLQPSTARLDDLSRRRASGLRERSISIGLAWTKSPTSRAVDALDENPRLTPSQTRHARLRKKTLYRSNVIWTATKRSAPLRDVLQRKQEGKRAIERIGMTVSEDMINGHTLRRRSGHRQCHRHLRRSADRGG